MILSILLKVALSWVVVWGYLLTGVAIADSFLGRFSKYDKKWLAAVLLWPLFMVLASGAVVLILFDWTKTWVESRR